MEVLQRTANRGSISTGYDIDNSCKFEDANDEYFTRTNASGTNDKTFTVSFWFKRTKLGGVQELWDGGVFSEATRIGFGLSSDELWLDIGKSSRYRSSTTQQFRDTSAWYHIVWKVDTTQSTEADRFRVYVNGAEITDWASRQYPTQNFETSVASGLLARIGSYDSTYHGSSGYMAEFNYLDGLAVAPTEFGEYDDDSGIWIPKEYTGSYPGQSCYLDFSNSANLGSNAKGDDVDWTANNIAAADQATDTPTNNFCTLAGEQQFVPSKTASLVKEGGTTQFGGNVSGAYSTMGVRSGKWYFESTITNSGGVGTENHGFGCIAADRLYDMTINGEDIGADIGGWACAGNANPRNNNVGASGANYVTSPAINKVLGCAIDMDNGKIWWHNEGTWHSLNNTVGNPATGASPAWSNLLTATDDFVLPAGGLYQTGSAIRVMNFGGYALPVFTAVGTYSDANGHGSFSYQPPSGFYALCTKNLAEYG